MTVVATFPHRMNPPRQQPDDAVQARWNRAAAAFLYACFNGAHRDKLSVLAGELFAARDAMRGRL